MRDDTISLARGGHPRETRVGSGLGRLGELLHRGSDLLRPCPLLVSLWLGHLREDRQVRYPQVLRCHSSQISRSQFLQAGQIAILKAYVAGDGGEKTQFARVPLDRLLVVDAVTLQDGARLGQLLLRHLFA